MTLNQLEYVLAVAKYGSYKNAALKTTISQPALSMQILKLENELGLRIFDRSNSPLSLTADGELFLERALEIVTSANRLLEFTTKMNDDLSGEIKLGIIPTLAPFLVPLFVDQLLKDLPTLKLDIHELVTERVVNSVRSGEIDAGIISTPIDVYGIESIPMFYEKFYLYTSDPSLENVDNVLLETINYETLWLLEEGNCFRDQINNFCDLNKIRKNRQFIYRSNSIDALIRIVDTKGGMTILPELSTLSLTANQEENVKKIAGKPKAREIALIVRKNHDKERFIEKIKQYIQSNIPKSMLTSAGLEIVDPDIKIDYQKSYYRGLD